MHTCGQELKTASDHLTKAIITVQGTQVNLKADITKMKAVIANLQNMITAENRQIEEAKATIGMGISALIAGITLAPAEFGPATIMASIGALYHCGM